MSGCDLPCCAEAVDVDTLCLCHEILYLLPEDRTVFASLHYDRLYFVNLLHCHLNPPGLLKGATLRLCRHAFAPQLVLSLRLQVVVLDAGMATILEISSHREKTDVRNIGFFPISHHMVNRFQEESAYISPDEVIAFTILSGPCFLFGLWMKPDQSDSSNPAVPKCFHRTDSKN